MRYEQEQDDILTGNFYLKVHDHGHSELTDTWKIHKSPRFLTHKQVRTETTADRHYEFAFGNDTVHRGVRATLPMCSGLSDEGGHRHRELSYNGDVLELQTRNFLWERMRIKQRDGAATVFFLFFAQIFEIISGGGIIGLVTPQFRGGDRMLAISGYVAGIFMLIGGGVGTLGSVEQSELLVRFFLACTYFIMSLLTALLYIQFSYLEATESQCKPSNRNLAPTTGTDMCEDRAKLFIILIFCLVGLGCTFVCNYLCQQLLDSWNDLSRLNDMALCFRYFTYRFHIIREKEINLAGTRRMFGRS